MEGRGCNGFGGVARTFHFGCAYISAVYRMFRTCFVGAGFPSPPSFRTGEQTCSPLQRLMHDPSTAPASGRRPARRRGREMGLRIGLSLGKRDPLSPRTKCGAGFQQLSLQATDAQPLNRPRLRAGACSFPRFCSAAMFVARIWLPGIDSCCPGQASTGPRSGAGTGNSVMHQSLQGGTGNPDAQGAGSLS